ncbi:MAG: hypothetical protein HY327_09885 [Chloroflexi bacterium]|nr:hypothetical protein [Chloroflexota bacterium]
MPVYAFPDLLKNISPGLKKRMQGKSCFNFRAINEVEMRELERLTKAGAARFKKTDRSKLTGSKLKKNNSSVRRVA